MGWFTVAGIKEEIRKIHWPKKDELFKNSTIVVAFVLFFMLYFVLVEIVLVAFLKMIGIGG